MYPADIKWHKNIMNNIWEYIRKFRWNRQVTRNAKVPNLDEMENLLE